MKKILALSLILSSLFLLTSCQDQTSSVKPQVEQMRSICELATLDCYYHNVAKYKQEDAQRFLTFTKDKHFWIEYSGEVKIGIDASQLLLDVSGDVVKIGLPPAKVLSCKVDETTLNEDSFIIAKDSANITAEDQTTALRDAQAHMLASVSNDTILLANGRQQAKKLIEDYINNIGQYMGKKYQIEWYDIQPSGTSAPEENKTETEV